MSYSLDGLQMNAVHTASTGVVNAETIFEFHQTGSHVHASYAGGRVVRGFLVGKVEGARLEFRYCQLHEDGELDGGHSVCELQRSDEGLLQIVEHFDWDGGQGTNVIQELPPTA